MGGHGLHDWWYRCLTIGRDRPRGHHGGERMHKARHTAGQRVLDQTGNLKAVQKLLGHARSDHRRRLRRLGRSPQLAATMAHVLEDE